MKLMVAQERRLRPKYRRIRELVTGGALGELVYVRLQAYQNAQKKFDRACDTGTVVTPDRLAG